MSAEGAAGGRGAESILLAPWVAEPYRLWSLLDMQRLFADHIVRAVRMLDHLTKDIPIEERISFLNILRYDFEAIGLCSAVHQIDRIKATILSVKNPDPLDPQVKELEARYLDDLKETFCFILPRDRAKYWTEKHPFGTDVSEAFHSAIIDIEEAGKCLACRRWTAAVFHLMRVTEVGLRALKASLNDERFNSKGNPSWERILDRFREELKKDRDKRTPEWTADELFYSGAAATLMAVKEAWRNPTMHVEINYDEDRAIDVWDTVRIFMRHLATKLVEAKPHSGG